MLVNIITIAVVIGFQNEVSNKVLGFGSHAYVGSVHSGSLFENEAILKKQDFLPQIKALPYIQNVQPVAYKPAILQSQKKPGVQQEIQSVMVKGVDESYDFAFFKENLVSGRMPHYEKEQFSDEILISQKIASDLGYHVGDQARAFFVNNQPLKRMFKIVGIFETGMEDLDKKIIVADIKHVQYLNDWGMKASVVVLDTLIKGHLVIKGEVVGGNRNYRFDWGEGYETTAGFIWYPEKDTVFRLIASDYWMFLDGRGEETSIPDTAYLKVRVKSTSGVNYPIKTSSDGTVVKKFSDSNPNEFKIYANDRVASFEMVPGKGSYREYVGAYELNFKDWEQFDEHVAELKKLINFQYSSKTQDLGITSIKESQKETFVWLSFLNINVWIIISLMLIIGIINMGSALLVMILMRTSFIGMLKAMGATNWSIRKIFLIQVSFLILKGMFWGNVIGIGLCLLQDKFQLFKLKAEVYYLNAVPIELNYLHLLLINALTLIVCVLAMIIPSVVISRISPSKSIRFN